MSDPNLLNFLHDGNIIRTRLGNSMNWITNIVLSINGDSFEIDMGLEKEYIGAEITKGQIIRCKYTVNNIEYMFEGAVANIKTDFPQAISIITQHVDVYNNNRDSCRYDVNLSSVIKAGGKNDKGVFAILVNISHTGAALVLKENIESMFKIKADKLEKITFWIDVYISPELYFSFESRVVRKKTLENGIEYGLRIINISAEDEKKQNKLLSDLANQDKEFYNKQSRLRSSNK